MSDPTPSTGEPTNPPPPPPPTPTTESLVVPPGTPSDGPHRSRTWLWVGITAVAALVIGAALGYAGARSEVDEKAADLEAMTAQRDEIRAELEDREAKRAADEAATDRLRAEQEAAEREAAERRAEEEQAAADEAARQQAEADRIAQEQAAAEAAKSTIPGSGIFEIGADKNPGTYRTQGPVGGRPFCYYAVLSSPNGSGIDNIISNNNIGGPGIVSLQPGQFFETNGCSEWTRS